MEKVKNEEEEEESFRGRLLRETGGTQEKKPGNVKRTKTKEKRNKTEVLR